MKLKSLPGILAIGTALAGCASNPPMHFYTLSEIDPVPASAAPVTSGVRVDRVSIPAELDRAQLVRRIDSTELRIEELDRWAGPLDETIRRVLTADLAARWPDTADAPKTVSLTVQEFYADASCNISLRAEWILQQAGSPDRHGVEAIRTTGASTCTTSAIPEAMSRSLAELSDRIAAAVARR
jgi:uncharacterized protein